jgi:hypothetical protein
MQRKLSLFGAIICGAAIAASSARGVIVPMPLDGTWIILDQGVAFDPMVDGDFFTDTYAWDSPDAINFTLTDYWIINDHFELYDFGALVLTTPVLPNWNDLGWTDPFSVPHYSLPYTGDPDVALASGFYSSAAWEFAPGQHQITIRDLDIPRDMGGSDFFDGTVAFKAQSVPDAAATWQLLGLAVLALEVLRRRQR